MINIYQNNIRKIYFLFIYKQRIKAFLLKASFRFTSITSVIKRELKLLSVFTMIRTQVHYTFYKSFSSVSICVAFMWVETGVSNSNPPSLVTS